MPFKFVRHSFSGVGVACFLGLAIHARAGAGRASQPLAGSVPSAVGVFVENRGQWEDHDIRFAMNSGGVNVGLTDHGPRYQLLRAEDATGGWKRHEFRTVFPGARAVAPAGERASAQRFNYHRGSPASWRDDVMAWESVHWQQLYPGVDLRVTGRSGGVKSDFVVAPGADWRQVRVRYEGIERLEIQTNGALAVIPVPGWPALVEGAPVVYQETDGRRTVLKSHYELVDERTVAFALEELPNLALPLVLDPEFTWGACVGGDGYDTCNGVAVGTNGSIFVVGTTKSGGWVSGGYDTNYGANLAHDAFVACLDATGTNFLWSTYLGGGGEDFGNAIAVDAVGNVVVVGGTTSPNWVAGGYDTNASRLNGNYDEGFLVKLSPAGAHLWSSYLGGAGNETAHDVATDGAGSIYVCGEAWANVNATNNWLSGGPRTNFINSGPQAFVVKLTPDGSHAWSGLVGGGLDYGYGVAVNATGEVALVGETQSSGWAVGGYDTNWNGSTDGFAASISATGTLLWSSYLGGSLADSARAVVAATNHDFIVAGSRSSGVDGDEVYVVRLSASGALLWERTYGGDWKDIAHAVALNESGAIFLAGETTSPDWVFGAPDFVYAGGTFQSQPAEDGFLLKLDAAGNPLWSSYGGGPTRDIYYGVAVGDSNRVYCAGITYSTGLWNDTAVTGGAGVVAEYLDGAVFRGDLRVTLDPAAATTAGVQWRRLGTTNWLNPGTLETNLPIGPYTIEFKETIGWISLTNFTFALTNAVTNDLQFTVQAAGSDFTWAGYVGGTGADRAQGVAADRDGNVVVVGYTDSSGWVSGGYDTTYNARDGFVAKFAADGTPLWSTYLGGAGQDYARGVAVDANGNLIVVGETPSSGWISGGYDTTWGGSADAFVMKLSPTGAHLWSTYLGGSGADYGYAVAADPVGDVYVAGKTGTASWATNGYDTTLGNNPDGFVARITASGALLWSSYLGGSSTDIATGIALDASGNVFIAGESASTNWVAGGYQTNKAGATGINDAFLVKLAPDGSHLWSTFIGGTLAETGNGVAALTSGAAIVVGQSASSGWIVGGYDTNWTTTRGYAAAIGANGYPAWSTYLGSGSSEANSVCVNPAGTIYLAGYCSGTGTNWTANGADATRNGGSTDAFVVRLGSDGTHHWSTFYGGSLLDYGLAIASATNGIVHLSGYTTSTNIWTFGSADSTHNGGEDAFVTRLLDRYEARGPLWIQQVALMPGGELQLLITASGWSVAALALEATDTLQTNAVWATEPGAVFNAAGAGLWDIRILQPLTNRFYRIRGNP